MDREIMKGSIDILLLNLLNGKDMYGYEMVKVLKEKSEQLYSMGEGTLYPGLKRMEKRVARFVLVRNRSWTPEILSDYGRWERCIGKEIK